jgi:hypothetical protein
VNGFTLLVTVLAAAFALAAVISVIRALPRLTRMERVVLVWWILIAAVGFLAIPLETARAVLLPLAGVLMIGLGLIGVLNYGGIADRLAARRTGIEAFWQQQSAASWRLVAAFLTIIGLLWTFGSLLS